MQHFSITAKKYTQIITLS